MLTIGQLKEIIKDLPDNALVGMSYDSYVAGADFDDGYGYVSFSEMDGLQFVCESDDKLGHHIRDGAISSDTRILYP